ncbi:MAG: triose-phosphate isomerase [Deltaproteobacteria bacterium]|nr:triose-phosphate isomerase [Deltaproteobacteria bacterium]
MRRKLLLGNWKMFKGPSDAKKLGEALKDKFKGATKPDAVAVFPPALSFASVRAALDGSPLTAGVQNLHWEKDGAFTGEISAAMAKEAGAVFALIGHSERRQYFGETDETVNKKTKAALANALVPVVCVGETLQERDGNQTNMVLTRQLKGGLAGLSAESAATIVVAYEPVWAIGTGRVATPEQAEAAHAHIRNELRVLFGALADSLPIVYGGSVKPDNARGLMSQPNIDGALVGGASLDANGFYAIGEAF